MPRRTVVATRAHILKLKCTTFDFGWGSAQYPTKGAYSALHIYPLLNFMVLLSGGEEKRVRKRRGKERKRRQVTKGGVKREGGEVPNSHFWLRHWRWCTKLRRLNILLFAACSLVSMHGSQ